ncbi:hypothetical protein [Neisseria sp. S1]|uniref:hypothetical protein n=1 Tax=Neisseria sp. S1 TaxID=3318354 RepID=UPI003A849EE3
MIIINSADYVIPEFRNEFGMIPPSFLPIGNKKLLSFQVQALRNSFPQEQIILSLPKEFSLGLEEQKLIDTLKIEVVFVTEGLSLGMALLYLLNTVEYDQNETLRLLHGDTLLDNFPAISDCISLARTQDDYAWEFEKKSTTQNPLVWCGYFSFSSIRNFIRALANAQGSFTSAVHKYADQVEMHYPETNNWFDLGHINTYFRSRSTITTQRAFNSLKIKNGVVWKSGILPKKIEAEAKWFNALPSSLKRFTPQLIQFGQQNGKPFYETEYLPCLPLNEIFVHGKNPAIFWENILGLISYYMGESRKACQLNDRDFTQIHQDSVALYADKTFERLQNYAKQTQLDLHLPCKYDGIELASLWEITQECVDAALAIPEIPAIVHGDLCFSNIMYDSRINAIKVIDPRGLNMQNEFTIYGNQSYDLAKLCHSIIGLYDFIIADSFSLEKSDDIGIKISFNFSERLSIIQQIFMKKQILPEISNQEIMPATILLFLSMIPLHFDKPHRQEAMLANALRLYVLWKQKAYAKP